VEPHEIARRRTSDDTSVQIWSDGAVTYSMCRYFAVRGGTTDYSRRRAREAAELLAGEVELYELAELRKLATTARRAVQQRSLEPRAYLCQVMSGAKLQTIKKGAVVQHRRSCECPRCERERLATGGTPPLRNPDRGFFF
jgi:hypothetical protein